MQQSLSLDVILSTIDKASRPLKKIDQASGETAKQFKAARDQLKKLNRQQKDLDSFKKLQQASRETRREFSLASARSKVLSEQLAKTKHPTRALVREFDRARTAVNQLGQKQAKQNQYLKDAKKAMKQTGIGTSNLAEFQKELKRSIEATDRALAGHQQQLEATRRKQVRLTKARQTFTNTRGMSGSMAGTGMAATAGGTATMLAVAKTASVGMDFDATMSKVQALTRLDKESPELAALRNQARNLGATTKFTAADAAGGQSFLAMAGFDPKAIKNAMPGMLSLAAAAGEELAATADVGSNILSGFQLNAAQMGSVGDILTATFTRSNTTLAMLGETMSYVGPVAAGLGSSLEEASAMAGKLGDIGIQASSAGTAMRAIYSRLAAPPKMAADAIDKLNITTKDSQGNLRPIAAILKDIDNATKGMGNTARAEMLKAIAGANAYSALEGLAVSAGTGELQKLIETLRQSKGEANKVAKVMSDNAAGDLKELVSSIQDVAIEITSLNDGSLRDLIQNITGITRSIGNWIKENPELAASIAKVVTVSGAMLLGFGAIALILSTLLMPFAMLRFGMTAVGIKGIGLVKIVKQLGGAFAWLAGKTLPIARALAFASLTKGKAALAGIAKAATYLGKTVLPMLGRAILWIGRALLMNPIGLAVTAIAGAAYLIYTHWEGLSNWFGKKWAATQSHFNAFKVYLGTWWDSVGGTFSGAIISIGASLINWSPFGMLYTVIANAVKELGIELPAKFTEFGAMLIDGLISGITHKTAAIKESILGVGDKISGWFSDKLKINSPSKVFIKHGASVMYGLEKGLDQNKNTLYTISDRLKKAGVGLAIGAAALTAPPAMATESPTASSLPAAKLNQQLKQASANLTIGVTAISAPAMTIDQRPLLSAQTRGNNAGDLNIEKIEINAAPGMDAQEIARLVTQEIQKHQQQQRTRARSDYRDLD